MLKAHVSNKHADMDKSVSLKLGRKPLVPYLEIKWSWSWLNGASSTLTIPCCSFWRKILPFHCQIVITILPCMQHNLVPTYCVTCVLAATVYAHNSGILTAVYSIIGL